ncbi:MAG: amidase [Actinobacteria bacterium]|nr:amidase [Actinomycetota bacterium]
MRRTAALARPEWADVPACAELLASGRLSSAELVAEGLARIAAYDGDTADAPGLSAVVAVNPDAYAEADAADDRRRAGKPLSALDGVTFVVKDCIETSDLPTTHGSPLFTGWRAASDAPAVARLRAAGMVLLAKVALDDFAAACFGECSVRGVMHNPWDDERMVSGSSGGSAIAVAAGYAPLALGTDTGGSLRIPAALTGVATLRGTGGLVPTAGVFPVSASHDVVGAMATTIAGIRHATALLSARSLGPADRPATRRLGVVRGGLAIWGDDPEGPVLRRFDEVCELLRTAGFTVTEVPPPPRRLLDASSLITSEMSASVGSYLAARPDAPVRSLAELFATGAFTSWARIALARGVMTDADPAAARRAHQAGVAARHELRGYTARLLAEQRLDAVLYPGVQRPAAPIGVEQSGVFTRWSENTGLPAVGVPMGQVLPEDGDWPLPCSLELLGAEDRDDALLDLASAVERELGRSS